MFALRPLWKHDDRAFLWRWTQGARRAEVEVSKTPLEALLLATQSGRADRFLARNPDLVSADVADGLVGDFQDAVAFGDLGSAMLAAAAAGEVYRALGMPTQAHDLEFEQLRVQRGASGTEEELLAVREQALSLAAAARGVADDGLVLRCWLLAADCAHRTSRMAAAIERSQGVVVALRDLCDVAEWLAELAPEQRDPQVLKELMVLVASVCPYALDTVWDDADQLPVRALLRRLARAAERTIPRGLSSEIYADPALAKELDARVLRLMLEVVS
jgi:hypothetical protein